MGLVLDIPAGGKARRAVRAVLILIGPDGDVSFRVRVKGGLEGGHLHIVVAVVRGLGGAENRQTGGAIARWELLDDVLDVRLMRKLVL